MAATMRFMAKIEVEIVGGDDERAVGMLQRRGEATADDVAEHVEDHDVGVLEQVMLLQELHRLADDIAAAAGAGRRAAGLDAHDAVVALVDEVLDAQLLAVEVHALQHVDDGRHEPLGQREGRIVLRVAADLQHALADLGERGREIGRHRALADAALAVDREHLRGADRDVRDRAATCTLPSPSGARFAAGYHKSAYCDRHAATSRPTPSTRSSSSSPALRSASSVAASGDQ